MPIVTKGTVNLSDDTISELIDTTIDRNNQKQKLTKDPELNEIQKEINKTLKTIKEQNDEIIGDKF